MERSVRVPLSPQLQDEIAERLRLASGLMETAEIAPTCSEYELRNSLSRLYYAFFHASIALLSATESDIEQISRNHGALHARLQRKFGKTMLISRMIRELYEVRKNCDYETGMFRTKYGGNIEAGRKDSILLLKRAKTQFYWLYHQARKYLNQK
jgi:uncharacterized protein (UPF0332 family)